MTIGPDPMTRTLWISVRLGIGGGPVTRPADRSTPATGAGRDAGGSGEARPSPARRTVGPRASIDELRAGVVRVPDEATPPVQRGRRGGVALAAGRAGVSHGQGRETSTERSSLA